MPPPGEPYTPSISTLHQERRKEALPNVLGFFLADTTKAVECFRMLFESQKAHPLGNYAGPDATVNDMCTSFPFWADALHYVFGECDSMFEKHHRDTIAEAGGLLDLYQDIILWSGFSSEHQVCILFLANTSSSTKFNKSTAAH